MNGKNDPKLTYAIIIALLIVGIACYAYAAINKAATDTDQPPLRIMMQNDGGAVWFDHQTHTSDAGYALSCENCHHNMEDLSDYSEAVSCSDCHEDESDDEDMPSRKDSLHQQCGECHAQYEKGPVVNEDDSKTCFNCHEPRL